MKMEESELTRKAIAELMKEMDEYKEKEMIPKERKKNPLGKPNKLFLGRTIHSIMNHNKRQADNNQRRCERKLKELDSKKIKHESRKRGKGHYTKNENTHEISSSESCDDGLSTRKRKKKKKRRKKKHRSHSTSSSSTSCSSVTNSSSNSSVSGKSKSRSRKKKRQKIEVKEEDYGQEVDSNYMGYYVAPNMTYAAMAYSQMISLMQQQQLRQLQQQQAIVEGELEEENIEIPSDLSISCHSSPESSLNISLHSSSAEEDENGVLTFKLSSDDDEKLLITPEDAKENSKNNQGEGFLNDKDDKESLHSHISLDSKDSEKSRPKESDEIYELSSCDSDELEIIDTAQANT